MEVRLVAFDMAGTTVDDGGAVYCALQAALEEAGLTVPLSAVDAVMGLAKPEALRRLIVDEERPDLLERLDAIHESFVERMKRLYRAAPSVREVPGTSALFERLGRSGIVCALDTGFSRDIAQVLIDRFGWNDLPSVTSDEVARGRPHPDMIHKLMETVGLTDPRQVAKVGDTPSDLLEGAGAGCGWNIGVTRGSHTREQLQPYPHTHLIETVADLPALFGL